MTKLRNAVIAGTALLLAGYGSVAHAAQPGIAAGSAPRGGAPAITRPNPVVPHFAPAVPRGSGPSVMPGFAPAPANRNFNPAIVRPHLLPPGVTARHIRVPPVRSGAPFVPTAPQVIPKAPPAAAWNRHERRDRHGRRHFGRYPYGYPYANPYFYGYGYGYGAGLGVPYFAGGYLADNGAYGVCFRLLQKYRETGAAKWRKRYDKCLAGDYSQLDYLD